MTDKPYLLLVEGKSDSAFFEVLLQRTNPPYLDKLVIGPPAKFGAGGDGKSNAMDLLPLEIENLGDGKRLKISLIVDADFTETNNGGFVATQNKLSQILNNKNYFLKSISNATNSSLIFSHKDGLPDINVWVMPNNKSDGYLETFVKNNLIRSETTLFENAERTVQFLATPKFRENDTTKAEIATWMAWQSCPGQPLYGAIGADLIDLTQGSAKQFIDWLDACFL